MRTIRLCSFDVHSEGQSQLPCAKGNWRPGSASNRPRGCQL